jgi:glyoxylase-like metal-dependent hydrolase (beta-lactamase superfamily II)
MKLIDVLHCGREHVIGAWLVDGVVVDPGPASTVDRLLDGLDGERPRALALTHIHLDHAGAVGTLVRKWPDLEVWVHERGAPHLADPEKLLASAARLYGDDMDRLWGETLPVPRDNLRVLGSDGEERIGDFRVMYTPGHASHHVSYLHEPSGTAFTGDAAGVRIGDGPVMAPTPPPDVDLEAWRATLDAIEAWSPSAVAPTHFGRHENVGEHLDAVRAYLDEWSQRARELDQDAWIAAWREFITRGDEVPAMMQAMPVDQQYAGLERYWRKRDGG